MKLSVLSLLIAFTLALAAFPAAADPSDEVQIARMINANYVFRSGDALCSATLFNKTFRWVLTNFHCIEESVKLIEKEEVQPDGTVRKVKRVYFDEVTLSQPAYGQGTKVGELTLNAEVLAFSPEKDLAVLRIQSETTPLPDAASLPPLGYRLRQGQTVFAVGNPVGQENTLTRGILSHLYREHRWDADRVARYIQTDATIAGGSSGGALYSEDGHLIGIPSAGFRGVAISYAIPFDVFKTFLVDKCFLAADDTVPDRAACLKAKTDKDKK